MKDLDGGTVALGSLLSQNSFFRIPEYQRPYSWDKENFEDLIDDLADADWSQQYFLGTIVLHSTDKPGNYDVVDGQQRMTSLMILLACLRDATSDPELKTPIQQKILQEKNRVDGIPEQVRLEVRDTKVFSEIVVTMGGTKSLPVGKLPEPESRYVLAVRIFSERIEKLSEGEIGDFIAFISQHCVVIKLATSSFNDAFRLFTIVNDRGLQLRRIDVLKAANMSPDVISKDTLRNHLATRWSEYEIDLGSSTFESIFPLIRLVYVKDKPQGDLLHEFDDRIFGKKIKRGETFFNTVFEFADLYRALFVDRDIISIDSESIIYNNLVHIMDKEFSASEWRACLLMFARKFGDTNLLNFLYVLEKVYLEQWVAGVRKDERYSAYTKILASIEGAATTQEVIDSVKFDSLAIIKGVGNPRLYGAGYAKYVLLRLELLACEHDQVRLINARSIEHVLPQEPKPGSKWLEQHSSGEIPDYVHSVGNLVLISKAKNSSASNNEFEQKIKKYLSPRVSDYPRSAQVTSYPSWTKKIIQDRTNEAVQNFLNDLG